MPAEKARAKSISRETPLSAKKSKIDRSSRKEYKTLLQKKVKGDFSSSKEKEGGCAY